MSSAAGVAGATVPGRGTARTALVGVALALVVVLGAWLRFVAVDDTQVNKPIRNDARDYVAYAYNVKNIDVYSSGPSWPGAEAYTPTPVPDAQRPPGYPLLLIPLLDGAPDDAFVHRVELVQAALGVLLVLLAFVVGRALLGDGAGLAVALFVALSPHLVVFVTYVLTETLYALTIAVALVCGVVAAMAPVRRRLLVWAALTGLALGLASLVRPTLDQLPWVLLVVALVVPALKPWRVPALLLLAGFLVVQAPWIARNLATTGHAGDPALMIRTLHHGSYPDFMYNDDPATRGYPYAADPRSAEAEASLSSVLHEIGVKFAADPARMLRWYFLGKPRAFLQWEIVDGWGDIYTYPELVSPYFTNPGFIVTRSLMLGLHGPLAILGVLGMLFVLSPWARRVWDGARLRGLRVVAVGFAYAIALHVVGAPFPRYSVPFRLLQYVLAAALVVAAVHALRAARERRA